MFGIIGIVLTFAMRLGVTTLCKVREDESFYTILTRKFIRLNHGTIWVCGYGTENNAEVKRTL